MKEKPVKEIQVIEANSNPLRMKIDREFDFK